MKTLLSVIIFLISFGNLQSQDQDTMEQRVIHLLDISGSKEAFDVALIQMIDLQKDVYENTLSKEFFETFKEEAIKMGREDLYKLIVPIYKKHFTLEEINGIIEFHESEVGKKMVSKMPMIVAESMQKGAIWGEELGEKIAAKILDSDDYKMNAEPSECGEVKNGKWKIKMPGSDINAIVTRKEDRQMESLDGEDICSFKVEWLTPCKYSMTVIKCQDDTIEKEMSKHALITNIYEVTKNGYKFITKFEGMDDGMMKGEAINYGKSNSKM
ncbi:MAG: DUF2059 domain-containing protein [Saprospiraceae bacterium]